MKISRIKETCLYVKDLERTRTFYQDSLGLGLISKVEGRHIFFRAGSSVLLCFVAEKTEQEKDLPPHGAYGRIHFAFEVEKDAYNDALQTIEQSGIEILHHHTWKAGLRSFYFSDPDGHLVEIIEEGIWG
jgi:catechol 2,3-dioxygenase-like lactoylglutathione lyase family enzyme